MSERPSSTIRMRARIGSAKTEKCPLPIARVKHAQVARRHAASRRRAGRRRAIFVQAQVGPRVARRAPGLCPRRGAWPRPPGAQCVFKQEEDHVVLGEKLRHRRQFVAPILTSALLTRSFFVPLPELVDPAEAVVGEEDFAGQRFELLFELLARFGRKLDFQHRVIGAKDGEQHALGELGGQLHPVAPLFAREFADVVERSSPRRARRRAAGRFRPGTGQTASGASAHKQWPGRDGRSPGFRAGRRARRPTAAPWARSWLRSSRSWAVHVCGHGS